MRRFRIASLIIATVVGSSIALPANADVFRTVDPLHAQRLAQVGRAACGRSFADARCATYQNHMFKAVVIRVANRHRRRIPYLYSAYRAAVSRISAIMLGMPEVRAELSWFFRLNGSSWPSISTASISDGVLS